MFEDQRRRKLEKLKPFLRDDLPRQMRGEKYDYLSADLRALAAIADTTAVSANGYDPNTMALIEAYPDGLLLDCGAGSRPVYFENVVNFEIVDYPSTDVLGVGEVLPFKDGAFDAVISSAVLEHVRDPFRCASEISRVLKPGGKLYCCVPFLQPLHGYPHHYYNMSHQGLRALWEDRGMDVSKQEVLDSTGPIWTLTWFLQRWARQLPPEARAAFLEMRVVDLLRPAAEYLQEPWVQQLPVAARFELASATVLYATRA